MKNRISNTINRYGCGGSPFLIVIIAIIIGLISSITSIEYKYQIVVLLNDIIIEDTLYTAPLIITCPGAECFQQSLLTTEEDIVWSRIYIFENDDGNTHQEEFSGAVYEMLNKLPETQRFYHLILNHNSLSVYDEGVCHLTTSSGQTTWKCSYRSRQSE